MATGRPLIAVNRYFRNILRRLARVMASAPARSNSAKAHVFDQPRGAMQYKIPRKVIGVAITLGEDAEVKHAFFSARPRSET